MFAHSSLLTTATQFADRARGAAMSLVAFSFMVGGAVGTALGGRLIEARGYGTYYVIGGIGLAVLTLVAFFAVPSHAAAVRAADGAGAGEGARAGEAGLLPVPAELAK